VIPTLSNYIFVMALLVFGVVCLIAPSRIQRIAIWMSEVGPTFEFQRNLVRSAAYRQSIRALGAMTLLASTLLLALP
jgi:hypothetical protein